MFNWFIGSEPGPNALRFGRIAFLLRERLGSLCPPVLLHIYYNEGFLLLTGWLQN
jgi:hypothetical protein